MPWFALHIYWDGSLGICCQEDHKLYSGQQWNISQCSIREWFDSDPVKNFRQRMLGDTKLTECRRCYIEEHHGNSKRINENLKSVIFTKSAFDQSFQQSPHHTLFENSSAAPLWPTELHVDLGNYCNLACKMCDASASSTIAVQEVKWGIESSRPFVGVNWTADQAVWNRFINEVLQIPNLKNIHFMGGETLLTKRFENFVDAFIDAQRFDVGFSFVSNGTVFDAQLMEKLKLFERVGIEISIETTDQHNTYQRQGTDTELVLANIGRYQQFCNNSSITVTLRTAISALTIGYYHTLLKFAYENKLAIKSLLLYTPNFLAPGVLPKSVRDQYAVEYQTFIDQLPSPTNEDFNISDPNQYQQVIRQQAQQVLSVLAQPEPLNIDHLQQQLVNHCKKWDLVYKLDARLLYPELEDVWNRYGY